MKAVIGNSLFPRLLILSSFTFVSYLLYSRARTALLTLDFLSSRASPSCAAFEISGLKYNIDNDKALLSSLHDFGSRRSGAIVVDSAKGCYTPGGMLEKNRDSYLQCTLYGESKFVVIRFNEDIQVVYFMLLNNEQYSSNLKVFSVNCCMESSCLGV